MPNWNQFNTDQNDRMTAEVVTISGNKGDLVHAYFARPLANGSFPGVVLIAHLPGWDEFYREITRRFAQHGYLAICHDPYCRFGHGTPSDMAALARSKGGARDDDMVGDCEGAMKYLRSLPDCNGKVGVIGTCSGGRHSYLAACKVKGLDAAVNCWGGRVVAPKEDLTPAQPVAPIDLTSGLSCPLLGIFGNDDQSPSPAQVNQLEAELKKHNKTYTFHRYDGAGHGFWYHHTDRYRPTQAMDAWEKVFDFFGQHLKG